MGNFIWRWPARYYPYETSIFYSRAMMNSESKLTCYLLLISNEVMFDTIKLFVKMHETISANRLITSFRLIDFYFKRLCETESPYLSNYYSRILIALPEAKDIGLIYFVNRNQHLTKIPLPVTTLTIWAIWWAPTFQVSLVLIESWFALHNAFTNVSLHFMHRVITAQISNDVPFTATFTWHLPKILFHWE